MFPSRDPRYYPAYGRSSNTASANPQARASAPRPGPAARVSSAFAGLPPAPRPVSPDTHDLRNDLESIGEYSRDQIRTMANNTRTYDGQVNAIAMGITDWIRKDPLPSGDNARPYTNDELWPGHAPSFSPEPLTSADPGRPQFPGGDWEPPSYWASLDSASTVNYLVENFSPQVLARATARGSNPLDAGLWGPPLPSGQSVSSQAFSSSSQAFSDRSSQFFGPLGALPSGYGSTSAGSDVMPSADIPSMDSAAPKPKMCRHKPPQPIDPVTLKGCDKTDDELEAPATRLKTQKRINQRRFAVNHPGVPSNTASASRQRTAMDLFEEPGATKADYQRLMTRAKAKNISLADAKQNPAMITRIKREIQDREPGEASSSGSKANTKYRYKKGQ